VAGEVAGVFDFEPDFWQERTVADLDDLLGVLAHLGPGCLAIHIGIDVARVPPDEQPRQRHGDRDDVDQSEEQPEARAEGREHRDQQDQR
jgi:hypothetical protein